MKISKQKLESLILEEIKSLQEGMPADPNLPSLKGLEASLPGDRLGQEEEIELLNSIGVDPQKYMIDMSAVEGMIERGQINSYEDLIGNESELDEIILRRPQPGETEAPRRTHRHTSGLGTDPVTRNMRRRGLKENKMKLTKQQLKHIIKEEIGNLLEVASKDMRVATLGKPGLDQNPQEDEATLDAVKSMSQRQPEGPIGVDTIQNAINSGDFSTMKNVVLDALDYLGKMRMRYAGAGTGGVVDRWAKNSYKYGLEREENNPTPERHAEARKEFVKEDLMSLLRFVQTGEQ